MTGYPAGPFATGAVVFGVMIFFSEAYNFRERGGGFNLKTGLYE
jgi:hypothetical protein